MDIRKLPLESNLPPYLDVNLPTIFLSECCLVYMDQEDASRLLRWISETFLCDVAMILYEPIGGHDAFGRMMIRNLAVRLAIEKQTDSVDQRNKFEDTICLSNFAEADSSIKGLRFHIWSGRN
jgi:[phosphatase 2A protein]-leucine-carboxy methyltransferase